MSVDLTLSQNITAEAERLISRWGVDAPRYMDGRIAFLKRDGSETILRTANIMKVEVQRLLALERASRA